MAKFKLIFKQSVAKDFKPIPKRDVARILDAVRGLQEEPRPPQSIKLSAQERYRLRVGRYRVLYEIQDKQLVVVVVKVAHRKQAYRDG